jgi:hypothetical protein
MLKQTIELFGRTLAAEVHGLKGERRIKVLGSLTNAEAAELGLSRITAWRSRRDGFFWLNSRGREDNSRTLSAEEAIEVVRCARIGAALAWRSMAMRWEREMRPFEFGDLLQEAAEWLVRSSARAEFENEAWRIASAKTAAMRFLDDTVFARRRRADVVEDESFWSLIDLPVEEGTQTLQIAHQVKEYMLLRYGNEVWDRVWSWANGVTPEPPAELADVLKGVRNAIV